MVGDFHAQTPDRSFNPAMEQAMGRIPCGLYVLTARFEDSRTGMLVTRVQQCSTSPPLVFFAIEKGQPIEPIIRDARSFALCQISESDLLARRRFEDAPHRTDDPFVSFPVFHAPSGAPILERATAYLDCTLVRHLDVENSTGIYIGMVTSGGVLDLNGAASCAVEKPESGNGHPKSSGKRPAR